MSFTGNPRLFLVLNTFTILFRFNSFFKYHQRKDKLTIRFCDFVLGLVWILHHTLFLIFLYYDEKELSETNFQIIISSGIAAILTVTLIILLQTLKFIIQIIIFL